MFTHSGQRSPRPIAPGQLLEELFDCFKEALRAESLRRYGLWVVLRHTEKLSEEDGGRRVNSRKAGEPYAALVTDVCCRPTDLLAVPLRLVAGHVGGNVYEIRCSIQERSSKWAYAECVSDPRRRTLALGKKMAAFCLSAVEKDRGRLILEKLGEASADGPSEGTRTEGTGLLETVAGSGADTRLLGT